MLKLIHEEEVDIFSLFTSWETIDSAAKNEGIKWLIAARLGPAAGLSAGYEISFSR